MAIVLIAAIITLLIFINGLYVAAEFSSVSARRPRLAQMAGEGSRLASMLLDIIDDPKVLDAYIAACQLGITVSSLVLGFYGQSQLTRLVAPWLQRLGQSVEVAESAATTIILIGLTILQVIFGELLPKNVGLQFPERLGTFTVVPMRWSMFVFRPLIWVFNGSGALVLRLFGRSPVAEHAHVHSPEEIRMMVEESGASGLLDQEERRLLVNTLDLRNLTARKVMIPRNRMVTASVHLSGAELLELLASSPYSRLPLYEESVDNIVGVVHLKDLLYLVHHEQTGAPIEPLAQDLAAESDVRRILHTVGYIPESMLAEDVLAAMQQNHQNLAVVIDEYGGTAGMVTMEDLFEEIIGEFQDEFDAERATLQLRPGNRVVVRGDVHVDDLNKWLGLHLPTGPIDTIGGLVFGEMGKLPVVGDTVFLPETLPDSAADTEDGENGALDRVDGTEQQAGLAVRVERMHRNSVAEVSFEVSPAQTEMLHNLVEGSAT